MKLGQKAAVCGVLAGCALPALLCGQSEAHGRKYQPPPATGRIVIVVEKSYNEKPLENAAVIFHATKDGKDNGNLEIKTNSQGKATMDLLETGSHVTVQIIATGYATAARDFDVTDTDQNLLIKMERPRAQVSAYVNNDGKAAPAQPGLQEAEHRVTNSGPKVTTATLSGTLKNAHGARVPGGIVRLHVLAGDGADVTKATDAEGNFRFDRVTPGTYDMQLSAPEMAPRTRHNLVLGAGDNLIYQESLQPAAPTDNSARTPLTSPAGGPR